MAVPTLHHPHFNWAHIIIAAMIGWLITTAVVVGYSQIAGKAPPGVTPVEIVAREPGPSYNVLGFCTDGATTVGLVPMLDAPNGGNRYIALRGTESVNWADSPVGQNPSAQHYWTGPDGKQNSELVEVTKDAAACLKRKVK